MTLSPYGTHACLMLRRRSQHRTLVPTLGVPIAASVLLIPSRVTITITHAITHPLTQTVAQWVRVGMGTLLLYGTPPLSND